MASKKSFYFKDGEGGETVQGASQEAERVLNYLAGTVRLLAKTLTAGHVVVKLVLPSCPGFIVRYDFLKLRMVGCPWVHSVKYFVTPQQHLGVPDLNTAETPDFLEALRAVAGAIVVHPSHADNFGTVMQRLDNELAERLSFLWTLPSPLTQNRLVIVGHRHPAVMAGYLASAYALGIRVTLVDAEGDFLPLEKRSGAVEQCIPIDMTKDGLLSMRIVDALSSSGPYHGIVTFTDIWMIHTAKAAKILGLYTLPLDLVKRCLDKHATRLLCQGPSQPLRAKSVADLQKHLKTPGTNLEYPLIVKPCTAWGSQGVYKATTEAELFDAVSRASRSAKDADLLIDTYVDGPEVDANFVLQDGNILFFEMVDGFPCTAEMPNLGKPGDFLETDQLWPSNHPQKEKDIVRDTLHALMLQMGIRDGVFHVEARIRNSAVHYVAQDGFVDLRPRDAPLSGEPSVFLLEINQRPPGHGGTWGTALSYGLDYPALHMLCALGERERYRALSQPFASGAVQWVNSVFINAEAGGIYEGGDVCQELRDTRPDLMEYVQYCNCYYEKGEAVTDSPARIALFVVASPTGKQKVLQIAQEVRDAVEVKMRYKM
ncbi:hypothetical protein DL762_005477 [Monosporascus cannonballus]|uniref:ATP-grasp domain-containing protein n=1 Tax=Monosporascus cannonballus TaxID=155416 RepID=A0ABY0H5V7_9PEZI|nr:hypothetical protein DL762_005477 [Monosporascus cannonballus]